MIQFVPEWRPMDLYIGRHSGTKETSSPFIPGNELPGYYRAVPTGRRGLRANFKASARDRAGSTRMNLANHTASVIIRA
jgi:hypothetical protein